VEGLDAPAARDMLRERLTGADLEDLLLFDTCLASPMQQAARTAVERMAGVPADDGFVGREIWLLRLRALLAAAHGDQTTYRDFRDRYHAMANSLGFEGHIAWADAVP
jgi:hypothetical protein